MQAAANPLRRPWLLKAFLFWELLIKPALLVVTVIILALLDTSTRQIALNRAGLTTVTASGYAALVAAQVGCAIAIWKWKKWGVYGIVLFEFTPWLVTSIGGWPPHWLSLLNIGVIYFVGLALLFSLSIASTTASSTSLQ